MQYPIAYVDYLTAFHAERDFFECHEILEEYWKAHPDDPERNGYHALIQIAVGAYHRRRGNRAGAVKMWSSARRTWEHVNEERFGMGAGELDVLLANLIAETQSDRPYRDFELPLRDASLLETAKEQCSRRGLRWGAPSPDEDAALLHKHMLRDRSDVIEARAAELQRRRS